MSTAAGDTDPLAAAVRATYRTSAARILMSIATLDPTTARPSSGRSLWAEGTVEFTRRRCRLTWAADTMDSADRTEDTFGTREQVFVADAIYTRDHDVWLRFELPPTSRVGGGDPLAILDMLVDEARADVRDAGHEIVRGVRTQRYDLTILFDVHRAVDAAPRDLRSAYEHDAALTPLAVAVWIDSDRRIRRVVHRADNLGGTSSETTVELYDHGAAGRVELPPPDRVVEADLPDIGEALPDSSA